MRKHGSNNKKRRATLVGLDRRVRCPHGTLNGNVFGDRLTVGYLTLNQVIEVRILFPELDWVRLPLSPLNENKSQSCGLAAKAPVLQTGDRRFESVQDYYSSGTSRPSLNTYSLNTYLGLRV